MAKLVKTDGTVHEVTPKNGKTFELAELQQYVGGYAEEHRVWDKWIIINEDGRRLKLPINRTMSYSVGGTVVGDALVCDPDELDTDDAE